MSDKSNQSRVSLQELNLLDSFLFSVTTENPENAKLIAKIIIRRVLGINTENIQVETEKQYKGINVGKKGIRLDVQVKEYNRKQLVRIYDIEPNSYIEPYLAKRNRYYLSLTDTKFLGASTDYDKLPEYFSIWILPYDPFGDNRMIYTVKNQVVENPDLVYNEGVTRVFLYTDGELGGTDEVRTLLKYFTSTNEANAIDSELQSIQSVIDDIKGNREVGERYMTLEEYCNHKIEHGIKVGIEARIESELEKALKEARDEILKKARDEAFKEARDEILKKARDEAFKKARSEVKEEVRSEVKEEVRSEVKEEVRSEIIDENIGNLVRFLKGNKASGDQIVSALMEIHSLTKEEAELWMRNN